MTVSLCFDPRGGQPISTALYGIIALTALGMVIRNGTVRWLAVPELTTTVLTLTVAALALPVDWNIGIGVFPQIQESLVRLPRGGFIARLRMRVSVRQVELCQERGESRIAVQVLQ